MEPRRTEEKPKKRVSPNRETTFVTYFFLILFLALMAYFIFFQIVRSEDFINSPYNSLQNLFSEHIIRGDILSADGKTLATTRVAKDGTETREYPYDHLFAHVVGYSTNGKAGLESQENFNLLRSHEFFLNQIVNELRDEKSQGDQVITTLNYDLQKTAYDALGKYDGAVVVMEPKTGKILCMVSKPDFDPNTISENWDSISSDSESSVLVNRATQGKYAPGSVFKLFTLLEYYRENPDTYKDYTFDCKGEYTLEGRTIHCASNKKHGRETLLDAFANSCNSAFADISLSLNVKSYSKLCNSLLFNQDLPIALESSKSSFTLSDEDSSFMVMETGIGQGKTMVSPLHMLLVTSAVANDGTLMRPYLVEHIQTEDGLLVSSNEPAEYGDLLSAQETAFLQEYMRSVVTDGTASKLSGASYEAYGKTGTAQVSDTTDQTNAWFMGYAQKEGYEDIAIAVIAEDAGSGSSTAVPIAKKVFDLYFN